jgi:hypothetical protein
MTSTRVTGAFAKKGFARFTGSAASRSLPEEMAELLKLRAIVDAMGSRGLFPIQ